MLAVRRSFITPFDRVDIEDLIQSMDDAIDMMHKTVKTIRLFENKEEFDPIMREINRKPSSSESSQAILLERINANATRAGAIAEVPR